MSSNILVVEDSEAQAHYLSHLLQLAGYQTTLCSNGCEALAAAHQSLPSIVLSDVMMPEMSGFELCRQLKQLSPSLPVILLTCLSEPSDMLEGLACGADNFIVKPYDKDYLLARVANLLHASESHQLTQEPGVSVAIGGRAYQITAQRQQILELLFATYDVALRKNAELAKTQKLLQNLNERLEALVLERTHSLELEVLERRRTEDALRIEKERLAESNAELEQLIHIASHDLQEPVRALSSYAFLLQERIGKNLSNDEEMFLGFLVEGAQRLHRQIQDLLLYSGVRSRQLRREQLSIADVLQEAFTDLQQYCRERNARLEVLTDLPTVFGERTLLQHTFHNLISNAVKFNESEQPLVTVWSTSTSGQHRIYVKDNGIGIPLKYRERVFGMFRRLHPRNRYEGTGMGLSICKKAVERHGGTITFEANPDGGTIFCVALPIVSNYLQTVTRLPSGTATGS